MGFMAHFCRRPRTPVLAGLLTAGVVGAAWTGAHAAPRAQAQRYVTVVDADGRPVIGLSREDFALKDGGVRRPIIDVEPATNAIAAVIVARGFAQADLPDVARAVNALVTTAGSSDATIDIQISLASGDDAGGAPAPVTAAHPVAAADLARARATADLASLPAAINAAAQSLVGTATDRRIVLALVHRAASEPAIDPALALDVVDALMNTKSALWTIEAPGVPAASATSAFDRLLGSATDTSGSTRARATTIAALSESAEETCYLWRGQYLVTYTWPDPMLSFFKLEVRHDRGVVLTAGWER